MSVILACDVGTSSLKLAAFDAAGRLLASAQRGYPTATPHPGWTEQDPEDWLRAFAAAVAELDAGGHVAGASAIAFTGQMS
ncbi:MAG: xylulokinase, partial [Rhizobiales bacterium]|nr:xylulokinase [Hyphomicrobiales bacterium]